MKLQSDLRDAAFRTAQQSCRMGQTPFADIFPHAEMHRIAKQLLQPGQRHIAGVCHILLGEFLLQVLFDVCKGFGQHFKVLQAIIPC